MGRVTQKVLFERQTRRRAQPSCYNCRQMLNHITHMAAQATYPSARLCFLPLIWSSQATLSFRVQSHTYANQHTSQSAARQQSSSTQETNLAIKATLLVLRRCTGNDNSFAHSILGVHLVIAFHQRRTLHVRLAEILDLHMVREGPSAREPNRSNIISAGK